MEYLNESQENLLKVDGQIVINEQIGDETVLRVKESLTYLQGMGSSPVTFDLMGGGYVNACLALYEVIRNYPGEKQGKYCFYLNVMGFIVLLACDKRYATENATLYLSENSLEVVPSDFLHEDRLLKIKDELFEYWNKMLMIICKRTGYSMGEVGKWCEQKTQFNSLEAKSLGFIEELLYES